MRYTGKIRFIDRYIGSAALFLFTLVRMFRRSTKDRTIKNVLIIELVEMAAAVMGYSSIRHIKEKIPDARIFILCTESTKELWTLLDGVAPEDVYALDNKSVLSLAYSIWNITCALSKKNIDLVIDFELFTRISAIISCLVKTKFRAGFYGYTTGGLYRGEILDIKCNFNQNMHIAKNLLALTKAALDDEPSYYNWEGPIPNDELCVPEYRSDPALRDAMKKKTGVGPFVLVAPTVGHMLPMRDYPKEKYVEVIRKLLQLYPSNQVLLVGTPSHSSAAEFIEQKINDKRCRNFCGQTASLRELLELFAMADLLITNDSGNPHFAAMVGLKNVALYGPETPFMYGPLGSSVCLFEFFHSSPSITSFNHKNPPSDSNASVAAIPVEKIVNVAQSIIDGRAKFGTVENRTSYIL